MMVGLRFAAFFVPFSVLLVIVACSASSHPPLEDPSLEGGVRNYDAGFLDVPEDTAGQCSDIPASSQKVDVDFIGPAGAPSSGGGAIADGIYTMSAYKVYANLPTGTTGTSGNWFKSNIRFTGSAFDIVTESDQTPRARISGHWSLDDTQPGQIHFVYSCPSSQPAEQWGFSATQGQFQLFFPGPGGSVELATYTQTQ
jgi:hypothetical protein